MIYIETNESNEVAARYYFPFDEVDGMGKSEEELLKIGYLVDEIPTFEHREGFSQVIKYDGTEFTVEYMEIPPAPLSDVEALRTDMNEAIMELSMLIEMGGLE